MNGSWKKIEQSTRYSGGDFVRRFVDGDEYRYKIIGPSTLDGFLELLEIAINGIGHAPEKRMPYHLAGWFLMENDFEIYDEGLPEESEWPRTRRQAVEALKKELDDEAIQRIQALGPDDFYQLHHDLGTFIRNQFGLWRGNDELLHDVDPEEPEPDHVSGIILSAFYKEVSSQEH